MKGFLCVHRKSSYFLLWMKPLANFKQVNDTARLGHRIRRDGGVNMHPCIVRVHRGAGATGIAAMPQVWEREKRRGSRTGLCREW